jgi:hypothetical protein
MPCSGATTGSRPGTLRAMSPNQRIRARILLILAALGIAIASALWAKRFFEPRHVIDVYPGQNIQTALEAAARQTGRRSVRVHAGTYRPQSPGQALIYFNARHEGISLEAVGEVVLTAANPDIASAGSPGYPAVVNHVVYFGDGISRATKLRGFKITGANGFVSGPPDLRTVSTREDLEKSTAYRSIVPSPIESNNRLRKTHYFYSDGGGILVYGQSYPTIEAVEVYENYASVCAGGVSVQNSPGNFRESVLFKDCVFRDNRAAVSGSGVDLLTRNSSAVFENCLFVGNLSNTSIDPSGGPGFGALTVLPGCRSTVKNCTFTGNRNGVDDRGIESSYADSIFWRNTREGGASPAGRYELVVAGSEGVTGCFIGGNEMGDPLARISRAANTIECPDPGFDANFVPHNAAFKGVGYRPRGRTP